MTDSIPAKLIAGDTWSWTREFADYPAPTWVATVYFENASGAFDAAASANGSAHAFSIDAATTGGKPAGRYKWSVRVVSGGSDAHTVESGWVEVVTNPAAAGTHDPRSDARKMLDALNAFLIGKATTAQQSMSLNGRAMSTYSLSEISQWRDRLRAEVATEEKGSAAGLGRNIKTRFVR